MSVGDTPDVLITIPISHFCEKARWALDRSGLSYVERPHLQVFHWAADIVEEASAEAPPERRLFPDDPGVAAEVRDLELDFDTNLGPHGRRWMYYSLRERRDIAIEYASIGSSRSGLPRRRSPRPRSTGSSTRSASDWGTGGRTSVASASPLPT